MYFWGGYNLLLAHGSCFCSWVGDWKNSAMYREGVITSILQECSQKDIHIKNIEMESSNKDICINNLNDEISKRDIYILQKNRVLSRVKRKKHKYKVMSCIFAGLLFLILVFNIKIFYF